LLLFPAPKGSFFDDLFDFPFWFTFYDIRWWFQEIGTVLVSLSVGRKKGGMEDIVYLPIRG
jgi:hypothetical protein